MEHTQDVSLGFVKYVFVKLTYHANCFYAKKQEDWKQLVLNDDFAGGSYAANIDFV